MKNCMKAAAIASILISLWSGPVLASVVINGTRVVFPSNEREVTVRLTNEGQAPGLVQVWVDAGDMNAQPEDIKVPFVLTPPLFRIDPTKGQTVRMLYNQQPLPQDRESLYWLNVLEVPPKPQNPEESENYMQMAFRTRIKIFFRPKALNSQEQIVAGVAQIRWKLERNSVGDGYVLQATNPTPYFYSFVKAGVSDAKGKNEVMDSEGGMVEPGKSVQFQLKGLRALPQEPLKVRYSYLNDYGSGVDGDGELAK